MTEQTEIKQVYAAPDGTQFATKREAQDYMRRPKIRAAFMELTNANEDLSDWLVEKQEDIESTFSVGQIRRVTKTDRNKLSSAFEYVLEKLGDDAKVRFIKEHGEDIVEGFKWPSVKRMDDGEKEAAMKAELVELADGNEEVADFIITNREKVEEAYDAGKVKRTINPAAQEGLAKWREEQAKKKAAEDKKAGKKSK